MIVALILLVGGIAVVWAAVLRLSSGAWPPATTQIGSWLAALSWGSTAMLLVTFGCVVLGLVLLVAAIKPGPPTALRLQPVDQPAAASTETVMTRGSVAKLANARARTVDAVDGASASVSSHRVDLTVKTTSANRSAIERQVHQQVADALHAAGLEPAPTIRVTAHTHQP